MTASAQPVRTTEAPSERVRVRRLHTKAAYDRTTIEAILDAALVAHIGFVQAGQPYVIPTLHARVGDYVYVHGSSASRTMRAAARGVPACLTVTLLDGLVLARSVFEMSANYRCVVVLGRARPVTDEQEKLAALKAFTERVVPGRWAQVRQPTRQELKATAVLTLPLDEASAKVASGGPDHGESEDASLPVWAGHLPLHLAPGEPVPCPHLPPGVPVPPEIAGYRR